MIEDDNIIKDGDDDGDQSKHWYLGIFYFNPKDKRIFVPKRYGFGWTNNCGNPFSIVMLLAVIVIIVFSSHHHK